MMISDDDDEYYYDVNVPNAIVSIASNGNGHPILVLNDSTQLYPVNLRSELYGGKRMRAFVSLRQPKDSELSDGIYADGLKNVYVNWIDTIRTKEMAPDQGLKNDSVYGNDPLEIVDDWTTCVEDGFLTIRFRTLFGNDRFLAEETRTPARHHPSAHGEVEFFQRNEVAYVYLQSAEERLKQRRGVDSIGIKKPVLRYLYADHS